jgi:hypothetical protein
MQIKLNQILGSISELKLIATMECLTDLKLLISILNDIYLI